VGRHFWGRLQNVDAAELRERLKPYLRPIEIDALLNRREIIVDMIHKMIAERGEANVLFDDQD
jgi:hypothetical protein